MRSTFYGLVAVCAAAGFGCSGTAARQVITGRVAATDAVAVRAVSGSSVVTASRVHSDGSFTLELPAGQAYRLEVLASNGTARPVLAHAGVTPQALAFDVCHAVEPYDMGSMGEGSGSGSGGGSGCTIPQPCDPTTDMDCPVACSSDDPTCPPPPPPCDMDDPMCTPPPPMPTPCDPTTDMPCTEPCTDMTDPACMSQPLPPPCDPTQMADCPTPPPPCMDPMDPETCQDPCMDDPTECGCPTPVATPVMDGGGSGMGSGLGSGSGSGGTCWPPPEPPPACDPMDPGGMSCPCDGWFPTAPPGDFGCGGSSAT